MSKAQKLSAELAALDKEIEDVCDQRIINAIFDPLADKFRRLIVRRNATEAEFHRIGRNVIAFPAPRSGALA